MTTTEGDQELVEALETARNSPDDESAWDRLEDVAAATQRFEEIAALYREVLDTDLGPRLAALLGQRAVQFIEEWCGEDAPLLVEVLERVLAIDPAATWAFQRLTVVYTAGGRWDDLFSLYDRTLANEQDRERRKWLLDEASNVAKDFANDPGRAIGYMQKLLPLTPKDTSLSASLERLLEREDRWTDLIVVWNERVNQSEDAAEVSALRKRIAETYLDQLAEPAEALAEAKRLVEASEAHDDVAGVLERIAFDGNTSGSVRREAIGVLKDVYSEAGRSSDVVRVLAAALDLVEGTERVSMHRESGQLLFAAGELDRAHEHFAALLELDPNARDALIRLRDIAKQSGGHGRFADALEKAASAAGESGPRVALRVEAADVRRTALGDLDAAITLYQSVLSEPDAEAPIALAVARRLADLLGQTERLSERLEVLERLARAEPEAADRRAAIGQAARVADQLGDPDRALALWQRRIDGDAVDIEALDAVVQIVERESRWEPLVASLKRRAAAPVPPLRRRADLVQVARIQEVELNDPEEAISTWNEIADGFGEGPEAVDALAALLAKVERWSEMAALLRRAADREGTHVAEIYARMGEVLREQLSDMEGATRAFSDALRIDPSHDVSRDGLTKLLEEPSCLGAAAEALSVAYRATDEWRNLVGMLEHRLAGTENIHARVRLLRETAKLWESRGEDRPEALFCMRRAMALAPDLRDIEADVFRLAEETGRWDVALNAVRDAIEALGPEAPRGRYLRFWDARICEERLSRPEDALRAYRTVFDSDPARMDAASGAIRMATQLSQWDGIAELIVAAGRVEATLPRSVVEAAEAALDEAGADTEIWTALVRGLEAQLDSTDLPARLGRELELLIGRWHRDRRDDTEAAERALARAAAREDTHVPTLRELASVQRREPGRALYDTLIRLADLAEDDLDPLREAADVALNHLQDPDARRVSTDRLYRESARLWKRNTQTTGRHKPSECARWALDRLVAVYDEQGEPGMQIAVLADAAHLPVDGDESRDLRRKAAAIAASVGDRSRAIALYRGILDEAPDDQVTLAALADVCEQEDRLPEMMALRQHELTLAQDSERRLQIRLDLARVVGEMEKRGGRVESLLANLEERPGHGPTIDALIDVLENAHRFAELTDVVSEQGKKLEAAGEAKRAAELWGRAAILSETRLDDVDRAMAAHRRVVDLDASGTESVEALARLHIDRGEHASATQWLERRLQISEGASRAAVALELAKAHLGAGQPKRCIRVLESALEEAPERPELREMLAVRYREVGLVEPLASLLTDAAPHLQDSSRLLAYAREAAALWDRLGRPEAAIPVLERAIESSPEDRELRTRLAVAFRSAGRLDEARRLLEEVVASYGRRRNAERAEVHHRLAEVYHAQEDLPGALKELELATKMDGQSPTILAALGSLAREANELDRAERAYRALLLIVRRREPTAAVAVGASEALFELSLIAQARGDDDQAGELRASAVEVATQDDDEVRRLAGTLRRRSEHALALRVFDERIAAAPPGVDRARLRLESARILIEDLDRVEEGTDRALEAAREGAGEAELLDAVRALLQGAGSAGRFANTLENLAQACTSDPPKASSFYLRLGEVYEADLRDLRQARAQYERVELFGHAPGEAWRRLARVARAEDDQSEEIRVLELLVAADGSGLDEEARRDAMYRLAEVKFAANMSDAVDVLEKALSVEPRNGFAGRLLREATSRDRSESAMAIYGSVARASGDEELLLDYLEKRAGMSDAVLGEVREGAELAVARDERDRAETLYKRAVELADDDEDGEHGAMWALVAMAQLRRSAGDVAGAIAWYDRAAAGCENERAFEIRLEAAEMAAGDGGDLEVAAGAYRALLEVEPMNRRVWEPLLDVYRRQKDEDALIDLANHVTDGLIDPAERNVVRLQRARFLLECSGREPDAADALREVLSEEPSHSEAAALLADLFERTGYDEDLVDLLSGQLDVARDHQDLGQIKELTLRLGTLLEQVRREDALDVYRRGLDWLPEDRDVALALLAQLNDEDAQERIEVSERLLATESGPDAGERALSIANQWEEMGNQDGVRRALEGGYRANPENDRIRLRLEALYQANEAFDALAAYQTAEARRLGTAEASVPLLRSAAAVYRDTLGKPAAAAAALAEAVQYLPLDVELLTELAHARAHANDHETAIAEVGGALEVAQDPHTRVSLLRVRAELRLASGEDLAALDDLEAAYALNPTLAAADLVDALRERLVAVAGDTGAERDATLRLVAVLDETGEKDDARTLMASWAERVPDDVEVLERLRDIDQAAERWGDLGHTLAKLVDIQHGEDQVRSVLRMADAYERADVAEHARSRLEVVFAAQPEVQVVRDRLAGLYERIGAHYELASLLLSGADQLSEDEERYETLRRAGDHFLQAGDPDAASGPLRAAFDLKPSDHAATVLLVDCYIAAQRYPDAGQLLETAISNHTRRRSPELAELQHRMAGLARAAGDRNLEMQWLNAALDSDKSNGFVASELAHLSMELGEHDVALNALRVVTLNKSEGPMSRAMAFLLQARIAHERGEARRALLWARKAKSEDPELAGVEEFLQQLGEA